MASYKQKSETVDAVQFIGNADDAEAISRDASTAVYPQMLDDDKIPGAKYWTGKLMVNTPDGPVIASNGDWIITHIDGTRTVMTAAAFAAQYEAI